MYSLTLLGNDGRLGPQLRPSAPASASSSAFPMVSAGNGTARINGRVSMDTFAIMLMGSVFSQHVINRTGLSGASIFTAVQEQLRLKLQAERGPVPVLVIDSVQRPTPD